MASLDELVVGDIVYHWLGRCAPAPVRPSYPLLLLVTPCYTLSARPFLLVPVLSLTVNVVTFTHVTSHEQSHLTCPMFLILLFLDTWGQARKGSSLVLRAEKVGNLTRDWVATLSLEDEE